MSKPRFGSPLVSAGIIFALGLALGFLGPRVFRLVSGPAVYNTATILKEVQNLSQLVTVRYVMERTTAVEDPPHGLLPMMFAGENRLVMVEVGHVDAGLDLSKLKPEDVQVSGKKVSIRLPPAEITHAFLDDKQTRVVERTTGFLREFDKDLEQTVRQAADQEFRRSALKSGILHDAESRGRELVKNLFHQLGFEEVEFKTN